MKNPTGIKNIVISIFVIFWIVVFNYESVRYFYLEPLFRKNLPKAKFLFPPAGWIMFFNVDESYGLAEVYGVKGSLHERIDPHAIFETRGVWYDNIHRNVLSGILSYQEGAFCRLLKRKFPAYDRFLVTAVYYPSIIKTPGKKLYRPAYTCE